MNWKALLQAEVEYTYGGAAKLMELVEKAVKDTGVSAEISKVEKINDIMNYGVMVTPALVINGEVKVSGRIPTEEEIKNWIR